MIFHAEMADNNLTKHTAARSSVRGRRFTASTQSGHPADRHRFGRYGSLLHRWAGPCRRAYSHRSTSTLLTPYSRGSMPYRCVHDVPHRHRCTRPALAWAGLRIGRIQPTDEFVTGRFPTVSLLPQANIPLETRSTARCISALLYKYQTLYPDFNFLSAPRDAARSAPRTLSPVPSTRSRSTSTSPTCRPC